MAKNTDCSTAGCVSEEHPEQARQFLQGAANLLAEYLNAQEEIPGCQPMGAARSAIAHSINALRLAQAQIV